MELGGNPRTKSLDPRVMAEWAAVPAIAAVLLWLVLGALAGAVFPSGLFGIEKGQYLQALFVPLVIVMAVCFLLAERRYRNYSYSLGEGEITITKDALGAERTVIRLEEVQNVKVSRSLLEKALGLATLKIETIDLDSEGVIPGLANYAELVDALLDRAERLRRAADEGRKV